MPKITSHDSCITNFDRFYLMFENWFRREREPTPIRYIYSATFATPGCLWCALHSVSRNNKLLNNSICHLIEIHMGCYQIERNSYADVHVLTAARSIKIDDWHGKELNFAPFLFCKKKDNKKRTFRSETVCF